MQILITLWRFVSSVFIRRPERRADDEAPPVPWNPERITASIKADNVNLKIGKYLHLEQQLFPGESGWASSKIDIPDSWTVLDVSFQGAQLILEIKDVGKYQISATNEGALSYAICCTGTGKKISDRKLEAIWNEYAKVLTD